MTRLAVVAYPEFEPRDAAWIEAWRAAHDPQAGLIRAHFTLVFPLDGEPAELAREVEQRVGAHSAFEIRLTTAAMHADALLPRGMVFLLPDQGAAEVHRLHDDLYRGALRPLLRDDPPYAPHVTVAAHPDHTACAALAAELNARGLDVAAALTALDIIAIEAERVVTIARVALKPRRA